jgi:hypothetical protein
MCDRLLQLQEVLQELASSDAWADAKGRATAERKPAFKRAKKTIESESFWKMVQRIVNCMKPMAELLRLSDRDEPSMGIAYSALMDLRDSIASREFKLSDTPSIAKKRREDVVKIIDRRIAFIVQPLYRAAFALNPRFRAPEFPDEVLTDLEEVLVRCLGEKEGMKAFTVFQSYYTTGRGVTERMEQAAQSLPPHEWWKVYGAPLQPLSGFAMRLLAQVPSASACERNWSAYKFVHSEKRNRLGKKRARDLVNVFQNLRATKRARAAGMELGQDVSNSANDSKVATGQSDHDDSTTDSG